MFEELNFVEESSEEEEAVISEEIEEVLEETPKRRRRKKKVEEVIIPLEELDPHLRPIPAPVVEEKTEPEIPESSATFPEGTYFVDEELAEQMLADIVYRRRQIRDKVAYLGQGRQKNFVLLMATWMVKPEGILYVPEQLAQFQELSSWKKLEEAPEGFVAFQAE